MMSSKRMIGTDPLVRVQDDFEGMMDPELVLLLHGWGGDATTNILDSSPSHKTVTAVNHAQIDTAQSVFGGSSILLDGTDDYLSLADSADWFFGTGDFTVDFRVRFNSLPAPGSAAFFASQEEDSNNRDYFAVYNDAGTYGLMFGAFNGGVGNQKSASSSPNFATGTWYHLTYVISGGNYYIFQDGVLIGSGASTITWGDYAAPFIVGSQAGTGGFLNGWLNEYRVSKGVARWTSNFTPPTTPYYAPNPRWTMSNTGGAAAIDVHGDALQIQAASDIAATIRQSSIQYSPLSGFVATGPSTEITAYMQLPSEGTANVRGVYLLLLGDASNYVYFRLYDNAGTYTRDLIKVVAGSSSNIKSETLAYNLTSYSPLVRIWIDATNIRVDLDGVQWQAATAHGLTFPQNQFYVKLQQETSRTSAKTVVFDGFSIKYNPLLVS